MTRSHVIREPSRYWRNLTGNGWHCRRRLKTGLQTARNALVIVWSDNLVALVKEIWP